MSEGLGSDKRKEVKDEASSVFVRLSHNRWSKGGPPSSATGYHRTRHTRSSLKACKKTGLTPGTITTFGGSDANRLNAAGIPTIVYACGMEKVHSTEEYTYIPDLKRSAELTLNLMTI